MTSKKNRETLIRETLEQHPNTPKKTLARMLRKKYPLEFTSVETARSAIRYQCGQGGDRPGQTRKTDPVPDRPGKLRIPRGQRQTKSTLGITTTGKWFVSGDWHVPYHDEQALETAVRHAVDNGCEHFYLNGDGIDFYRASQWSKDPNARSIAYELKTLREIFRYVLPHFPGRKIYKIGNHEDRLTRRIWQATPELACLQRFDVCEILDLGEFDFEFVQSRQATRFWKLWGWHGHELPQGITNPVNIARGLYLRMGEPAFTNHWHQSSSHTETTGGSRKQIQCFSIGCLCDTRPAYKPVNRWNHGHAILTLGRRSYDVDNFRHDDGKVYRA